MERVLENRTIRLYGIAELIQQRTRRIIGMGVVSRCYFFLPIKQPLLDGSIIIRGVILALFLRRLQVLVQLEVEVVWLCLGVVRLVHDNCSLLLFLFM